MVYSIWSHIERNWTKSLKFMFSKKATKIAEIFTVDLTFTYYIHSVKPTVKISLICVAFLKTWTLTTQCAYILFSICEVEVEIWRVLSKGNSWYLESGRNVHTMIFQDRSNTLFFVVVPFIFRILVQYETFFTRAQGPVIVIAKEEI